MKIITKRPNVEPTQLYLETVCGGQLGKERGVAFILPGGPGADHGAYASYRCLQDKVDLVFHDPRGCGQSDKGDASAYTMNHYIDDVEEIRQQLNLEKITLIGKSYGSMCALGYAVRYPQHMEKLVLAAGAPSYHFLIDAKKNLAAIGTHEQIAICEKLWAGSFASSEELIAFFRLTNSLYSVKARQPANDFNPQKKNQHFSYEVLNEGFKHKFWHFDYENDLTKITCPTLILAGQEDWVNDVKYARLMHAKIPDSHLQIFANAGHALETDASADFFQRIREFIA